MELTPQAFKALCEYVYRITGIELTPGKEYLVEQRLEPVAQANGCKTFAEFADLIAFRFQDPVLKSQVIEAITTNETSFFRDNHPFETFKSHILPWLTEQVMERKSQLVQWGGPKVRILCAGASTGQEPYSLAMILTERFSNTPDSAVLPTDFKILGADISPQVLTKAKSGKYSEFEIDRGLSPYHKQLYFDHVGLEWQVKAPIMSLVAFECVNFTEPFKHLGQFEVIFCRNMLIYFDEKTKKSIVSQFYDLLVPGGYLVIGSTENLNFSDSRFVSSFAGPSILYRKADRNS